MEPKVVLADAERRMEGAVDVLRAKYKGIRAGRATPAVVADVTVDYHGCRVPLGQLAAVSCPDPQTVLVRPYNPADLGSVERALWEADL